MTTTTIASILVGVAVAALLQRLIVQARARQIPAGDTASEEAPMSRHN